MKIKVYSQDGKPQDAVELSDELFGGEINEGLLHQVIVAYAANKRQGTSKTKTRDEVSGGGRKPFKQKGTGRARAGSNTSPVWVRGGKAFGPVSRSYSTTIPKKLRKAALRSALSSRAQSENIMAVSSVDSSEVKTRKVAAMLSAMSLGEKRNLFVMEALDHNLYLSGRNIKNLSMIPFSQLNAYDVVQSENVILGNVELVKKLEEAVIL